MQEPSNLVAQHSPREHPESSGGQEQTADSRAMQTRRRQFFEGGKAQSQIPRLLRAAARLVGVRQEEMSSRCARKMAHTVRCSCR